MIKHNISYLTFIAFSCLWVTNVKSDPAWVKENANYAVNGELTLKKSDGSVVVTSLNETLPNRKSVGRTPNIMVINSDNKDIAEQADFAFLTNGGNEVALYVDGLLVTLDKDIFDSRYTFNTFTTSPPEDFYFNSNSEQYSQIYSMQYSTGYYDPSIYSNPKYGFRYRSYIIPLSGNVCKRLSSENPLCIWDFSSGLIPRSTPPFDPNFNHYIEVPRTSHGEKVYGNTFSFVYRDFFYSKITASNYRPYHEEITSDCEHELWGPNGRVSYDNYRDKIYRTSGVFNHDSGFYSTDYQGERLNYYRKDNPDPRYSEAGGYMDYLAGCNMGNSGYIKSGNGVYYIVNSVHIRTIKDGVDKFGRAISNRGSRNALQTNNFTEVVRKYIYKDGEIINLSDGPVMYQHSYFISDNPTKPLVSITKDSELGGGDVVYILDTDNDKWINGGYLDLGFDGIWYENMKRNKP